MNTTYFFFFKNNREKLHRAIRTENIKEIKQILSKSEGSRLARAKNYYGKYFSPSLQYIHIFNYNFVVSLGRCSSHVAVLKENEEIVDYISSRFKQTLRIGDNVFILIAP